MPSRPRVPIWARAVGILAFIAALGMLVWGVFDLVGGKGVSEVVMDVFIAIVLGGIGATLLGLWRGGRVPGGPKAQRDVTERDRPGRTDQPGQTGPTDQPGQTGAADQTDEPPRR